MPAATLWMRLPWRSGQQSILARGGDSVHHIMTGQAPGRRTKVIFWILLALSSTYFAEVTVGNELFPFFTPFALLVAVPLYGLHILVLSAYVVRGREVNLRALFFAGMLFGLYEAYITKVIWDPYWSFAADFRAFGIAVPQTSLLILWYHNFFAFIIPLIVCELMCTSSSKVLGSMPTRIRHMFARDRLKRTAIIVGVVFGLVESVVSRSPLVALASVLSGAAVIALFMYHLREAKESQRFTLDELLPDRRQSKKLLMALLVFYAVMTPLLLPEKLPGLWPQVTVWALYAVAFTFLYFTLGEKAEPVTSSPETPLGLPKVERAFRWKIWWLFIGVYSAVAMIMSFGLQLISAIFTLFFHVAGMCLGLFIICSTTYLIVKRRGRSRNQVANAYDNQ